MAYELKRLNARHKRMVSLVLEGRWNNKQVASIMGLTPEAVGIIINSPAFQDEVGRRRTSIESLENENIANGLELAKQQLDREALPSVMKLADIRDNADDLAQARMASSDLLKLAFNREGGPSGGGMAQIVVMNAEKINFLMQCAKEAGIDAVVAEPIAELVEGTASVTGGDQPPSVIG